MCGFKFPPKITLDDIIFGFPTPVMITIVLTIIGIVLLLFRLSLPSEYHEPIVNNKNSITLNENVGVVFFNESDKVFIDNILKAISSLDITGSGRIKYKYNASSDIYNKTVNSLIEDNKCNNIILTADTYQDKLLSLAKDNPEIKFYVLCNIDNKDIPDADNIFSCYIDLADAIYAQGFVLGTKLTDVIQQVNNGEYPFPVEAKYSIDYLYNSDESLKLFEQFLKGISMSNITLSSTAVNVTDQKEYVKTLSESDIVHIVFIADNMPILTQELIARSPNNIYVSSKYEDISNYNNYMTYITTDYTYYIHYVLSSISNGSVIPRNYEGRYREGFSVINFNSKNLPIGTEIEAKELLRK